MLTDIRHLLRTEEDEGLAAISEALAASDLTHTLHAWLEDTELRRLALSPLMRLALQSLFLVARATGLQNRLFAIARARSGATQA